jgi:hypothetical protein
MWMAPWKFASLLVDNSAAAYRLACQAGSVICADAGGT